MVGVFALDQHVGLADRPGLVVPVLTEEMGIGVGVEIADVALRYREHTAGAASRVVDGLDVVGASRQSKRLSTVRGRMTLRYSFRLYGPRSRLQRLQMKLASWEW